MQKGPRNYLNPLQLGPWVGSEVERGVDRTDSGEVIAGGEGQGAREHKGLEAHLVVCLSGMRDGRRGLVGEEQSAAAEVLNGGGAPAG